MIDTEIAYLAGIIDNTQRLAKEQFYIDFMAL